MNKKMADINIDPFGEHESRPTEEPTDEHILLSPVPLEDHQLGNKHMNRKHHSEEESQTNE